MWKIIRRAGVRIIGIQEAEETQVKGTVNIFNKIIENNFLNLKKEIPIKVQEAYNTNRLDLKRKSPCDIIIKRLNIQNKERILKAAREQTK